MNLVDNAVKYTPPAGRVEIGLTADEAAYVITIRDSGPALAEDQRERIFERFYRGVSRDRVDGAGLGLPIAQSIAELHGGRIEVASSAAGNVFRISPVCATLCGGR